MLFKLVYERGPWPTVLSHHFKTPEEVVATTSGVIPKGVRLTWEPFLNATFRGFLGLSGCALYPEIEDCVYSSRLLDLARNHWGAKYARAETMLFNINGPQDSTESAHFDSRSFRGMWPDNTPVWLLGTMAKSGLFERWQAKKVQILAWFYKGNIGGFTYWPEGPNMPSRRMQMPLWNKGVIVQNELMFHKADSTGPKALRTKEGLSVHSLIEHDPDTDDWRITTDGKVVQQIPTPEMRFFFHWGAEIFENLDERKIILDRSDDLTRDRVFEMLLADMRQRGVEVTEPTDPMNDAELIGKLMSVYQVSAPIEAEREAA
jgi:hypothetical protein